MSRVSGMVQDKEINPIGIRTMQEKRAKGCIQLHGAITAEKDGSKGIHIRVKVSLALQVLPEVGTGEPADKSDRIHDQASIGRDCQEDFLDNGNGTEHRNLLI